MIFLSIICFSSFIFGIPYISNPPTLSARSNTVTLCPRLLSWSAAASPEGPEPITATFFPVLIDGAFAAAKPLAYAFSIIVFSFALHETGFPFNPQVHAFSHKAGHTLDVNSGKLFVLCKRL